MSLLTNKNALVTGGSRGIGRAVALELAKAGANVAVVYAGNKNAADEVCDRISSLALKAGAYRCDVSNSQEVAQTARAFLEDFGSIDILINNAGITKDGLILSMKDEDFDKVINTNLKGAFLFTKAFYQKFMRQKSGRIINISSVSGIIGNAGQANYCASKAGLIGLTKSTARELAARGVTCNCIAPGFISTDMTEKIDKDNPLLAQIPQKRMGEPEDVAKLTVFLSGDGAKYITGEVIRVDGGLAM